MTEIFKCTIFVIHAVRWKLEPDIVTIMAAVAARYRKKKKKLLTEYYNACDSTNYTSHGETIKHHTSS